MSHLRTGSINVFISGKLLFSSMLGAGHVSMCAAKECCYCVEGMKITVETGHRTTLLPYSIGFSHLPYVKLQKSKTLKE